MERKAIFAGSFNPFTIGHASVVQRALEIFDKVIITIGINAAKPADDAKERAEKIGSLYTNEPRVDVLIWNGLMVDLARRTDTRFFIRGIRNTADFEYERNMADINRRIGGIETIFFPTLPEHASISSSIIRELNAYGVDTSDMLP